QGRPDPPPWRTPTGSPIFQPGGAAGAPDASRGNAGRFRKYVGLRRAPGPPGTGGCLEAGLRGRPSGGGGFHSALEPGRRAALGASRNRHGWVCVDGAPGRRVAAAPENRGGRPALRRSLTRFGSRDGQLAAPFLPHIAKSGRTSFLHRSVTSNSKP